MKTKRSLLFASALLFPVLAHSAPLMPFTYRIKLPADASSCAEQANRVAAFFARASRAKAVSGTCQGHESLVDQGVSHELDVIVISYQSEAELRPDATVFGGKAHLDQPDATSGVFKTYAECLSALQLQTPLFVSETGLTPVAAYCSAATNDFHPGFTLTFESFGDLKKRLYSYSEEDLAVYGDRSEEVTRALHAVEAAGGHVVWNDPNRFFYYNEGRISVAADNLGMFEEEAQCSSQVAAAEAIYAQAGLVGVSAFCHVTHTASYVDAVLTVIGAGADEIQDIEADHYAGFAECRGDLDRVLQNSRSKGYTVYGGLCSPNQAGHHGFNAHIYAGY